MVKCSECKYLEKRTKDVSIPKKPIGPGPITIEDMRTERRIWFTCPKVNETISKKYGFRKGGYEITVHEFNDDRDCPDFKKK